MTAVERRCHLARAASGGTPLPLGTRCQRRDAAATLVVVSYTILGFPITGFHPCNEFLPDIRRRQWMARL